MNPITFSYQSDYKSYLKLYFRLLYKSWTIWLYYSCFLICVVSAVFNGGITSFDPLIGVAIGAAVILSIHLRYYVHAKNKYKTTPTAGEERFWKMDDNGIEIKSKSSSATFGWNTIYKIKSDKKWIFIFYNKSQFAFFSKKLLTEIELLEIKRRVFETKHKVDQP